MSESILVPVLIGLAAGIGSIALFMFVFYSAKANAPNHVFTVIVPRGAAIQSSEHNNFEPVIIRVKVNDTVKWVNEDTVQSSVVADNDSGDPSFFMATQGGMCNPTDESDLLPQESFEFTFTKAGIYDYHSVPHPWMQGTVIVQPKLP